MSLEDLTGGKKSKYKGGEFFLVKKPPTGLGNEGVKAARHIQNIKINILKEQFPNLRKYHKGDYFFFDIETGGRQKDSQIISISFAYGLQPEEITCAFARDPTEERWVINYFFNKMPLGKIIATYNGGFDISRLSYRALANGVVMKGFNHGNLKGMINSRHFDLYHELAEKKWKGALTKLRLPIVEKLKLEFSREGDIPSSEIPRAYYEYVYGKEMDKFTKDTSGERNLIRGKEVPREVSESKIARLIRHNMIDVTSLPAIFGKHCVENEQQRKL